MISQLVMTLAAIYCSASFVVDNHGGKFSEEVSSDERCWSLPVDYPRVEDIRHFAKENVETDMNEPGLEGDMGYRSTGSAGLGGSPNKQTATTSSPSKSLKRSELTALEDSILMSKVVASPDSYVSSESQLVDTTLAADFIPNMFTQSNNSLLSLLKICAEVVEKLMKSKMDLTKTLQTDFSKLFSTNLIPKKA